MNSQIRRRERYSPWRHFPWSFEEIRRFGDWGNASNQLGRAWEQFAGQRFLDKIPVCVIGGEVLTPATLLPLDNDPEFGPQLHQSGLRAPDAVLFAVTSENQLVLAPIDYKFSLDHAEGGQVVPKVIIGAGEALGDKFAAVVSRELELPPDGEWQKRVVDGALVTPSSESNHLYVVPGNPAMVWFSVGVSEFFDALPTTNIARWLASLDRVRIADDDFDLMSAYFRLGAGVSGGISRLDKPLFSLPEKGEVDMVDVDRLEEIVAGLPRRTTPALVEYVRPLIAERRELRTRLASILRRPLGRGALNRIAGFSPDLAIENWPADHKKALGSATSDDRDLTLAEAQLLADQGSSVQEVFDKLGADHRARTKRFETSFREALSSSTP